MIDQERLEWKYSFSGFAQPVIDRISPHFRPIAFGSQEASEVHSLYFEGFDWPAFRETLSGNSVRYKCRLRWYDEPEPRSPIFEIKRKQGFHVNKERFQIPSFDPDLPPHLWAGALSEQLPPHIAILLLQRDIPVCHIQYTRRHFTALFDADTRITVDTDLTVRHPSAYHPDEVISVPGNVLELKFPTTLTPPRTVLEAVGMRRSRNSKYRNAVVALGYHLPPE